MADLISVETVLQQLLSDLDHLDRMGATIAAAHLDAAIEALCRQFGVDRNGSDVDVD